MEKVISINRQARFNYFIEDTFEVGLVLKGTEIKSIRQGKVQLKNSFISIISNQAFIKEMNISQYDHGNIFNHDETRERKLLLHKREISKIKQKVEIKGYTVIPLKLYLKNGLAKLEIALTKGKDLHDKRQSDKEKTAKREIEKAMKQRY